VDAASEMTCAVCKGSGWSPHPLFLCGSDGLEIDPRVCDVCLGSGARVDNLPLFIQRIGRVLRTHREKHGESVFQESVRLGMEGLVGPKMIRHIERGELPADCAYAPRFVRRAARVAWRMGLPPTRDAVDPQAGSTGTPSTREA
jgi:hypothetical protein